MMSDFKQKMKVHSIPVLKMEAEPSSETYWQRYVRFEVFTAVTMKNGVFWDVTPCSSCKNRHIGGT
jgi:hypothetical protein